MRNHSNLIKKTLIAVLLLLVGFTVGFLFKGMNNSKLIGTWKSDTVDIRTSKIDKNGNEKKAGSYEGTIIENSILIFSKDNLVYLDNEEYKYKWIDDSHIEIDKKFSKENLEVRVKDNKLFLSSSDESKNIDYEVKFDNLLK